MPAQQCGSQRNRGRGDCHGRAILGSDPPRCRMHIGSQKSRSRADVRAAVARWTDGMSTLDPGELLLRLMTVASLRADQHADELDRILKAHGWTAAFVGDELVPDAGGVLRKVGEYAKRLAVWESGERKEAANLAVRAVTAGLEERRVRAEERYAEAIAGAVEAALTAAGVEGAARDEGRHGAERYLRAVESG